MLKLVTVLSLTASSVAFASNDVAPNTFYTSVCNVAKADGFKAAKSYAKTQGVFISKHFSDIECNGISLKQFADVKKTSKQSSEKFDLVDDSSATQLCAKAADLGIKAVSKRSAKIKALRCNGLPVSEFVKQVQTKS